MKQFGLGLIPRCWAMVLAGILILTLTDGALAAAAPTPSDVQSNMGGLQMPFIQNQGQVDAQVAFYAQTFGGTLFVSRSGELVLPIPGVKHDDGVVIRERLVDASIGDVSGATPSATAVSYFKGRDPKNWQSGLKTFESVTLGQVYPGIRMRLKAYADNVEKLFDVAPGADPAAIKVRVQGARQISIDGQGRLELETPEGPVRYTRPKAFQETADGRRYVDVAYELKGDVYSFKVGDYDPDLMLVIDPLLQSTYLGGGSIHESVHSFAIPPEGGIYLAGYTRSADFPAPPAGTPASYQPIHGGWGDAFVAILERDLTGVIQMTFVGSSNGETCQAMAIHPLNGQVYIAGHTGGLDFPGTAGGAQPGLAEQSDFYAARLSADLTILHQSTYLGDDANDFLSDMAIHPGSGDVYLVGRTSAPDFFYNTLGGAQETATGTSIETVVARLNADLTTFHQATYIGGSSSDGGFAEMAIHPVNGDIYVTGNTYSDDLPATAGGAQASFNGIRDAFVARINPSLTAFGQVTYYGGSGVEYATDIAVHPVTGRVYIAGPSYSEDLPARAGGFQPEKNMEDVSHPYYYDAYVARLDQNLSVVEQTTYLGGSGTEIGTINIAFHPVEPEIYIAGPTTSDDFPGIAGGAEDRYKWSSDAFISRLNLDLTTLYQSTYLGGHGGDDPTALAIDPVSLNVYIAGETNSDDFAGVTGGIQETLSGVAPDLRDLYVAVFDTTLAADPSAPDISVAPVSRDFGDLEVGMTSAETEFTISNSGNADLSVASITKSVGDNFTLDTGGGASGCSDTIVLSPGVSCTFTAAFTPGLQGDLAATLTISSDDPDEDTVTVDLLGAGLPVSGGDPDISVTPDAHAFGDVEVGATTGATVFTLVNNGSADLDVTGISLSNDIDFSIDTGGAAGCGDTVVLAPAASCTFTARFAPASQGDLSSTISIDSNDPDTALLQIDLTGAGQAAGTGDPNIVADPASVNFGALVANRESSARFCTISNTGSADLAVTEITNSNNDDFALNTGGGPAPCNDAVVLPPAGECTVGVTFRPAVVGDLTTTMTLRSNDPDQDPMEVVMRGRGTDAGGGGGGSGIACFINNLMAD